MGTEIDKKSQEELVWLTKRHASSGCVLTKVPVLTIILVTGLGPIAG